MRKNEGLMKMVVVSIVIFALTSVALYVGAAAEYSGGTEPPTTPGKGEADLVVLVGDIDNLGFGWPQGFDVFSGKSTPRHRYPYKPEPDDPSGTDRIMVGTSYDGHPPAGQDGYTSTTSRPDNLPQPISMQYNLGGIQVHSAVLQMFVDDFQSPLWKSKFQVELNGQRAPFLEEAINSLLQTGPIGKLITVQVPADFLSIIASGNLEISIDDPTTGAGDGFAIDFVRLLVNPHAFAHTGRVSGHVVDAETGESIQGATVSASGVVSSKTDSSGAYTLENVPAGLAVVTASVTGYISQILSKDLSADASVTIDFRLTKGVPPTPAWCDYFDSTTLDPRWSWVREDPTHWSLTANPGYLRITTQRGDLYQTNNDGKNLLLTSAPSGDFDVTTRVTINPSANWQSARLFIYQDDDNHFELQRTPLGGQEVHFTKEEKGSRESHSVPCDLTTVYLKITKQNSTYTGYWSTDGSSWTKVYQYKDIKFSNLKIGLSAYNGRSSAPEIPADFDYICVAPTGYSDFGTTEILKKGFKGNIYYLEEGTSKLPDFSKMTPVGTIYTEKLDIPPRDFKQGFPGITDRFEWFGISYIGGIVIPSNGNYTFKLTSDDGAKLYIDGELVIDNDGIHPPRTVTKEVYLTKGDHLIGVDYFQGPRVTIALQLFVETPEGKETPVKPGLDPSELEEPTPTSTPTSGDGEATLIEIAQVPGRNLAMDSFDNMYVSSYGEHKVVKVTPEGVVSDFATGISRAREGICDIADNLYVGDYNGHVWKITPAGSKAIIASDIWSIQGLALDNSGNLYVSSGYDDKIYKIDLSSGSKTVFSTALVSAATFPTKMAINQSTNDLYVSVSTNWPPSPPPGGPALSLIKITQADPSSYETIATLPGVYSGGAMHFNTNGNLLWSCLTRYVYNAAEGKWECARYESEILEVDLVTGALTEFLKEDGFLIEGMAFDSSNQFFIAGTWEITNEHFIYRVVQSPTLQPTPEKTEFANGIATPMGFAFDPDGRLFVGNRERGEVFGPITRGDNPPPVYASGLGAVADIAFNEAGYLYACNDYSGNIYKVPPGGGEVHPFFTGSTFAGTEPDPNSLNIAPPAFSGSKAKPGDLIVMDRDYGSYAKRHIVAISPTGEVTLLAGPEELPAVPSDGDFSPDGRFYATTEAGTIFTLDADGVITEFGKFNIKSISSLSINPVNGDIFVGGADKIFKIDPHTKDIVVFAKDFGVVPWWSALSVSPDGKTLYVGDSNADTVYTISL